MLSSLDKTPVVKNLIIINVIVFLLMNFTSLGKFYDATALYYFDDPRFGVWQIFTHMFQHAKLGTSFGFTHILFNMFVLFQFGTILEKHWGSMRFLFFYLFAGVGAALFFSLNLSWICVFAFETFVPYTSISNFPFDFGSAVGASGAISGIVAAFAFFHPNTELMLMFIPIPIKAKFLVPAAFGIDLVLGVWGTLTTVKIIEGSLAFTTGIAHFAHIGGAVFGIILVFYWQKNRNSFY
ncbi:MAG: rhomboid family intramembrane serine protease [Chitinophagales bacterium]